MRLLTFWPVTAAVLSMVGLAYARLCVSAPRELLPYLVGFGILYVIFLWINPKRRYFRLGSAAVGFLLAPRLALGLLQLNIGDWVLLRVAASEPGTAYYAFAALVALTCFIFDMAINSESPLRPFLANCELLSRIQFVLSGNATQTIVENNSAPVTVNTGIHNWGDGSGLHAEVTAAAANTLHGKPDVALALLSPLLARSPGNDKRLRFRIHANLGYAHLEKDDVTAAAGEFRKALQYEIGTEEACGLAALAALINGSDAEAHAIAADALKTFPSSSRALSVYVQTAPPNYEPATFSDVIKPTSDNDVEVVFALSRRCSEQNRFSEALDLARKAVALSPESPRLLEHLASTLLSKESATFREHKIAGGPEPDAIEIAEAIRIYDSLLCSSAQLTATTLSRIHYRQALCHWLIGDAEAAEEHFATALNLNPSSGDARRHFAQFEVERDKLKSAIANLRLIPNGDVEAKDRLMLAMLLYSSHDPQHEQEAFTILRDNVSDLSTASQNDITEWLGLLCQSAHSTGHCEWLERERHSLLSFSSKPWIECAFEAECLVHRGESGKAAEALRSWVGQLGDDDNVVQRQWCARLCEKSNAYDLALQVWKPVAIPSPNWPFWHQVLNCAVRCHDDEYVLCYCEQLRLGGCLDAHCLHAELDTLGKYHDDKKATAVIQSYVDKIVDDDFRRLIQARKSVFAIRCGQMQLVETDESQLPLADSVDEQGGIWTVEVLRKAGLRERAVRYAYILLRRFNRSPDVNKVFVAAFDLGATDIRPNADFVVEDDAVQYQEDDTEQLRWVVIETLQIGGVADNEVAPEHPVSRSVLGKRRGEQVVLRPDDIQPRSVTIKEIRSKYAYRAVEIIDTWEVRFPDDQFVKKFVAAKLEDGSPDVSAMVQTIQAQSADDEVRRQAYINNPLGIAIYSGMFHVTHIQAAYSIGQDVETTNRCSTGDLREMDEAVGVVQARPVVVVDPSSLATNFVTGLFENIERLPARFLITQSSLMSVHEELERVASGRTPHGYMQSINGKVQFVEHDENAHSQYVKRLEAFLQWIEVNSESCGGSIASKLSRSTREQMNGLFGAAYVESACLAKEEGGVHWTDDLTVGLVLDRDLKVPRCWTQAYLTALLAQKQVSNETFQKITVELLRCGVEGTLWNAAVVIAAGKTCDWRATHRPLQAIMAFVEGGDPKTLVGLTLQLLVLVRNESIVTSSMEEFLIAVMRRISERTDGRFVLEAITRNLGQAFGIQVAQAQWARDLIVYARETTRASRLIVP